MYFSDPDVVEAMKPWKEIIDREGSHVIGSTKVFLDASDGACRKGECNLGNLIANAFVDEVTMSNVCVSFIISVL
jgi:5'-nucleotidase